MLRCWLDLLLVLMLVLKTVVFTQGIDLVQGIITCMNNEDCIGANRRCIHNKTSLTGMCGCKPGHIKKSAQSFSCVKGPVMQQCETDYDCSREGDVCIIVSAPSERTRINGRNGRKTQKICIGTWLIYAADFDEPRTGGGLKHYTDDIFFKRGRRVPQQYVGFVEDMMLVLFLVCILVTLITVHRASCYRQFQDARRNSPLRHILPIGDDQPPPYSERQDSTDGGGLAEVVTEPSVPKRQSETPPPSYEEALYRNTVQLPEESEARTNMATDYLNDLDCLPSYNETRIRIFENINQATPNAPSPATTNTQDPLSSGCTENCTLLTPIPTEESSSTTTTPNTPALTPIVREQSQEEGVSIRAVEERQVVVSTPSTSQAATPAASPAATPTESTATLPLGLSQETQVVAEVETCCNNINNSLVGSTTKLNLHHNSSNITTSHHSPTIVVIGSGDVVSAIISDKQQQHQQAMA